MPTRALLTGDRDDPLKIDAIEDDTPVKVCLDMSTAVYGHRVYDGKTMGEGGCKVVERAKLIPKMLRRFMSSDRGFVRGRHKAP